MVEASQTTAANSRGLTSTTVSRGEIVFVSIEAGTRELNALDPRSGRVARVSQSDGATDPSWSPNRARISFYRPGDGLYIVGSNGTSLERIPVVGPRGGDYANGAMPAWSPNGRWLAYEFGEGGIALRNMESGKTRILLCQRNPGRCDNAGAEGPGWSPDSTEVVYWSVGGIPAVLSSVKVTGRHGRFWGNHPRTGLAPGREFAPDWSPDGKWLAVTIKDAVWKIPVSGRSRRGKKLAKGKNPVWSPDGKRIAFVSARDGDAEIFVMSSDGSHQRRLTSNNWVDVEPDW